MEGGREGGGGLKMYVGLSSFDSCRFAVQSNGQMSCILPVWTVCVKTNLVAQRVIFISNGGLQSPYISNVSQFLKDFLFNILFWSAKILACYLSFHSLGDSGISRKYFRCLVMHIN